MYKYILNRVVRCFFIGLLAGFSNSVLSNQLCFSLAENYYEQLYCELKARGKSSELPSFKDFRKNPQTTQALLLKRPAKKIGIQVVMPIRKKPKSEQPPARITRTARFSPTGSQLLPDCQLVGTSIRCAQNAYHFTGNRANKHLAKGVLSGGNLLGMPSPLGLRTPAAIQSYLQSAYQLYLQKMLEIGLGGATMSFNKFSYFFYDISDKGVSFNGRFETMFKYLKKDKQQMAVPQSSLPAAINLSTCQQVASQIVACAVGRRNYLFVRG